MHTHPNAPIAFPDHPEILVIKADEKSKRVAGEEWHTDVAATSSRRWVRSSTSPRCRPTAADTLFANMYRAYETLSEPIKQMLPG